jgi:putative addiction module CopG family antidote
MNVSLGIDAQKLIEEQVRSGKYASPEEVITAALYALDQDEHAEFAPGELDALLKEGDDSGSALDGLSVLAELRALRHARDRSAAG